MVHNSWKKSKLINLMKITNYTTLCTVLLTERDIAQLLHQDPVRTVIKMVLDHQQVANHAGRHALLNNYCLVGAVHIEYLEKREREEWGGREDREGEEERSRECATIGGAVNRLGAATTHFSYNTSQ